ncbi:MAG TPA: sodium:solute symporter [Rhizomicrobium sp.]|nr:sodium:solute symporter [Rhizomicrobium sp.]
MAASLDWVALIVFVALFVLVTGLGFIAARWRKGDLGLLDEWGLGGRRFGTVVTWFLLGGDLYTAYTFIAVPALMFGAGAIGFFAVPYATITYALMFVAFPRLWSVARKHGYVTAADFVRGRFDSRTLALAIATTGIIATMPYIALQLVGIEVVLAGLGVHGEWPLIIAFVILAAYTYTSGLRAPALIAVVKDLLIYVTIAVAIVVIPMHLGGFGAIFASVDTAKLTLASATDSNMGSQAAYATLAFGSALALFLYPHAITGVLSSSSRNVIKRNAVALPAYSIALGLIALLGYMALAAGVKDMPQYASGFARFGANYAVPALFLQVFPSWFVGIAFAAIAIGALVPAAIMSIACANLFTRNIYKEYWKPGCTPKQESQMAKIVSLVVKLGALVFILAFPQQYAIQLQLLGGIWMSQTLPTVIFGLYTRKLHPRALLIGWAGGIAAGTAMAASLDFKGSIYPLHIFGWTIPCYAALSALALNIAITVILSVVFNAATRGRTRVDATVATDYA